MSEESTPYDAAIADLEARIQHFQTMLDNLKLLRSQVIGGPVPVPQAGRGAGETEIMHDSFFGMTIGDAAKKYLMMTKATKSTSEIGSALERGGLKHSSKDFNTTVRSVLGAREDFLRVNGDWGLTEWYPGMRREKKVKPEKPEKPAKPAKSEKQAEPVAPQPKSNGPVLPDTQESEAGKTRRERILEAMRTDPDKGWTAGEVAKMLNDSRKYIQSMMVGMTKTDELVKDPKAGYRLPTPKAA